MSETPQQHGWQPPDLDEPQDKAQSQRGFGLFEAPPAPDEFPVFTPYKSSVPPDDFPPDSSASQEERPAATFSGFPADEQPYVPAPAVVPIPGVAHDAFPADPPPAPITTPSPESSSESSSGSDAPEPAGHWAAFAAGEAPRQPTPPPWEAPASLSYEPSTYEVDPPDSSYLSSHQSPYEPAPEASESPVDAFQLPVFQPPEPEPFHIPSQSAAPVVEDAPPVAPGPVRAAAPVANRVTPGETPPAMPRPVGRVYGSAAATGAASPAAAPISPDASGSSGEPAGYSIGDAAPVSPGASDYPAAASGGVFSGSPDGQAYRSGAAPVSPGGYAAASDSAGDQAYSSGFSAEPGGFPAATPVSPGASGFSAEPAGYPPAAGDAAGLAGASGFPSEAADYPAAAGSSGGPGYSSDASGFPAESRDLPPDRPDGVGPVSSQDPSPAAATPSGLIRATFRPSNIAQPDPSDVIPTGRTSTIYSSPTSVAAPPATAPAPAPPPAAPALAPRQARQHTFGDLLEPGPGGTQSASVPMQRGPQPPAAPPVTMPPPVPPQRSGPPAASLPPPREQQQSRFDQFAPQTPKITEAALEPRPERKGRLIIGVLAGCATLLAVAFGGLLLIDKLVSGPTFKIDDCVKQSGMDAVAADCREVGAFKVVSVVASQQECDQTQPYVEQENGFLCLQPASGAAEKPQATPTQSP